MEQNKVFVWLAEEMLKSAFIQWVLENGHTGISYPTLSRAQERQETGAKLTARQQKAERLAQQFYEQKKNTAQAA